MPYTFSVKGGDSGGSYFVIANVGLGAEPIYCGGIHMSNGGAACAGLHISAMNAALSALGSPYVVSTASLGSYASY